MNEGCSEGCLLAPNSLAPGSYLLAPLPRYTELTP